MASFDHHFDPPGMSALGNSADLTIREIEDAGLQEILKSPGAKLGTWSLLGALLDHTTPDFLFLEPLGLSREVKTAMSGLIGRFVARAYAKRHLNYSHFAHIHSPPMPLAFGGGVVERVLPHDLPDWAAWDGKGLAIIEAKGSHSWAGPSKVLQGAYEQAERVVIRIGGNLAPLKRFAIVTRWGFASGNGPDRPMLWVKDPATEGEGVSQEAVDRLGVGIAQRHCGALLNALGHGELGDALMNLSASDDANSHGQAQLHARDMLDLAPSRELDTRGVQPQDELIGAFVTRSGPIEGGDLSPSDRAVLSRLKLRPAFVGVERRTLKAVIEGAITELQTLQAKASLARSLEEHSFPTVDGAGTWVFRPDEDDADLRD